MSKMTKLLFLLLPLTTACTPLPVMMLEKTSETQVIGVKGDPMTFIRGTVKDTTSGIPIEITEDKEYSIRVSTFITEKQTDELSECDKISKLTRDQIL